MRSAEQPYVREALNPPLPEVFCPFNVIHLLPNYRNSSAQNEKAVWACICIILVYGQNRKICDGILSRSSDQTIENFMKYNFISKNVLSAVLLAGGVLSSPVLAENTTSDSTEISYTVAESYA